MPPLVCIFRLVAPVGTATEKNCRDPVAPEILVCSKGVTVVPPPPLVLKLAVTVAVLVPAAMVQLPVPLQAPLQAANVLPLAACATSVTVVLLAKLDDATPHSAAQLRPAGLLVTLPVPLPDLVSVTRRVVGAETKLAVTLWELPMLTVHCAVAPEQAPLQPLKLLPAAGVAVSTTLVPGA